MPARSAIKLVAAALASAKDAALPAGLLTQVQAVPVIVPSASSEATLSTVTEAPTTGSLGLVEATAEGGWIVPSASSEATLSTAGVRLAMQKTSPSTPIRNRRQ